MPIFRLKEMNINANIHERSEVKEVHQCQQFKMRQQTSVAILNQYPHITEERFWPTGHVPQRKQSATSRRTSDSKELV